MIYFDYAATTPLDPEAAEVYLQASTHYFGNASSLHDIGSQAALLLDNCRTELGKLLGVDSRGLYFTSGGSEGNFLAIEALLSASNKKGNHIISGIAEHSSVHGVLKRLEKNGYDVTLLPFGSNGTINLDQLKHAMKPETSLVIIQHINSEIGTIQPIEAIGKLCKEHDIYFHSDFVQSFGKIDLRSVIPYVSSFSFSGHKIYGPKGIGGVYLDPQIVWQSFFPDTSHEKGFRPGTVNIPAIAAMTAAAQKTFASLPEERNKFIQLRKSLLETLSPIMNRVKIFQAKDPYQLPNIVGLSISGIEGQWMMLECNRLGLAISTGSACQLGMQTPAKVTEALGVTNNEAKEFIRISFGQSTTQEDVLKLGKAIVRIVKEFAGAVVK
ncbi:IscS subfamily cysteine desulfurase [Bacillus sp. BRMEA1]|uniref:IscS subfamily cysteine desulfurase n=1 Tax=Neobacillus endophyticus TaxID=2738405 RepID=UPI001564CAE7|nr:IscS subfamily cysteine desulfurase [Neobacillus endophyticus]NRD75977.1 IscS subfamily cysteine desulfurase [Neobacillus endophyticus]